MVKVHKSQLMIPTSYSNLYLGSNPPWPLLYAGV